MSYDIDRPEAIIDALVIDGLQLLQKNLRGELADEFRAEFISYWNRSLTHGELRDWSLLTPERRHRPIAIWTDNRVRVLGEDDQQLRAWLKNGDVNIAKGRFGHGALVWLDVPPIPDQYPNNAGDLLSLVKHDDAAMTVLGELFREGGHESDIVLGAVTESGVGFGAVRILPPAMLGAPGRRVDPILKGFRPGHVPPAVAARRALSPATAAARVQVDRIDHDWIHGRDADDRQALLKASKVTFVGVGSLGSTVARLLARAGVGHLTLIDPDNLAWSNLGRHELGANWVTKPKATSLATDISSALPHLHVEGIPAALTASSPFWDRLQASDLVISTSGNWLVESLLNEVQQAGELPPTQFAWVENHAVAAHSLVVSAPGACLRCGMGPAGQVEKAVTEWPNAGLVQVPACGGVFSPYGASELAFAHAITAEHALDHLLNREQRPVEYRVWIGRTQALASMGGTISESWRKAHSDPGAGGNSLTLQWAQNPGCPVCQRRLAA